MQKKIKLEKLNKILIYNLIMLDNTHFNKKKKKNNNLYFNKILTSILFIKLLLSIKLIDNNNLINKLKSFEIEKGFKKKKLGIYLRNFSKDFFYIENIKKYCYLIIRFVRKNLFLTLLNKEGNVICKTNIGSCGFKKKVKFTGYAIKRTSKKFSKKILKLFVKTIYSIHKNFEKKSIIKENYNALNQINSVFNIENKLKRKIKVKIKKQIKIKSKIKKKKE